MTSIVIVLVKSPCATAVVTRAISRTCDVRFDAIRFTESVRSFHTPETPCTRACAPSLPSPPTSCATRVTSEPNCESRATMPLTMRAWRRNSPRRGPAPPSSSSIVCSRSPWATAVTTRAISFAWPVRSSITSLTAVTNCAQPPVVLSRRIRRCGLTFLADGFADVAGLVADRLHHLDELVERLGDLAVDARRGPRASWSSKSPRLNARSAPRSSRWSSVGPTAFCHPCRSSVAVLAAVLVLLPCRSSGRSRVCHWLPLTCRRARAGSCRRLPV